MKLIVGTTAAIFVSGAVLASADKCGDVFMHHVSNVPTDFGHGYTAEELQHEGYHNPSGYWSAERVTIRDCAADKGIRLERTANNGDGSPLVTDKSSDVSDLLVVAASQAKENLVEFLAAEAGILDIPFEVFSYSEETCGCSVFYPELRGDKKEFAS